MKRFCALFACTFFIIVQTITYIPVSAVGSSVDFGEMLNEYLNVAEVGLALSQGVTIDWSDLDIPENLETDQEKAKYIVNYIGALRHTGIQAIYDWMFNGENDNPYLQNTAAIGLSTTSGIGSNGTQDIRSQLADVLALNNGKHIIQRYNDAIIARWNNYNVNYINDYIDNSFTDSDDPVLPDVPENVETALHNINSFQFPPTSNSGTFWQYGSLPMYDSNMGFYGAGYSYVGNITSDNVGSFTQPFVSDNNVNVPGFACIPVSNIYITSENGVYSYTFSFTSDDFIPNTFYYNNNYSKVGGMSYYPVNYWNQNMQNTCYMSTDYPSRYSYTRSDSGTLLEVLNNISYNFRAVNIYIDGVLTSLAYGNNISSGITFNVPDAVIDSGTDDGKIVAHPIYYPDTVKNGGTVSIDLDTLNDIIAQKVSDGATSITMDDIIDAGAVIDADGTTLTDADTASADVSIPISKAGAIDTTLNPTFPNLNIIPPLPKLPDINTNDANAGFQGMSVLARIINVTVQSVPEPLILTFFGVIFGVVILGIIKILHH